MENIPSWQYAVAMTKKPYPSETQDRFIVRLPDGMRDTIAAIAKKNGRSMNAEIVARLERTMNEDLTGNVISRPQFLEPFMARLEQLMVDHGVEYIFPDEDYKGRKRVRREVLTKDNAGDDGKTTTPAEGGRQEPKNS